MEDLRQVGLVEDVQRELSGESAGIENPDTDLSELWTWLGRRQALAGVAGSCSAADAECLRQIRDGRKYRGLNMTWDEFCQDRVGMARKSADRIIQRLERYGPGYFTFVQVAGVTESEYQQFTGTGVIEGESLMHQGERIAIKAENAPQLCAAVSELRKQSAEARASESQTVEGECEKAVRALRTATAELLRLYSYLPPGAPKLEHLARILLPELAALQAVQFVSGLSLDRIEVQQ
jgi:hypothetical protein